MKIDLSDYQNLLHQLASVKQIDYNNCKHFPLKYKFIISFSTDKLNVILALSSKTHNNSSKIYQNLSNLTLKHKLHFKMKRFSEISVY
jgi:hypothetical protein